MFLENKQINAFVYGQRYNLFDFWQKFILFEQIFIWLKDTLNQKHFISFE